MEEDVDQIAQLQAINNALYATIAALRQEIAVLRERITAAQIGIMLLNQTLEEHDDYYSYMEEAEEKVHASPDEVVAEFVESFGI